MGTNVLVIGSGGREHCIAQTLSYSKKTGNIFVAPGNGGTQQIAKNVDISAENIDGLLRFAESNRIDLTIVGSEKPLALGITDAFRKKGLLIFGPSKEAALIETSKSFAKNLMIQTKIPTAGACFFHKQSEAERYLEDQLKAYPVVVKADGLAAGKGVSICYSLDEALLAVRQCMEHDNFAEAGRKVLIENFLEGQEASFTCFSDGKSIISLLPSQDHKHIYAGDRGAMTGGMGAYAPVPWFSASLQSQVNKNIVARALTEMEKLGRPFRGCLYTALMINSAELYSPVSVLEFNARLGDPETQAILTLLDTDALDLFMACAQGKLENLKIRWNGMYAVCVVLASDGYPFDYDAGFEITGLKEASRLSGVYLYHAGTELRGRRFYSSGGRVLGVTGVGNNIKEAAFRAYEAINYIQFKNMYFRRDIGAKALGLV